MPRHILETRNRRGELVRVTMGYDRAFDALYCEVASADGERIYSNLSDPDAGPGQADLDYYRFLLQDYGIEVPEAMYRQVSADQKNRAGDGVVMHGMHRDPS